MKRLTDEELAELARTWPWACEDQSIERSVLADLRRYKTALEEIRNRGCGPAYCGCGAYTLAFESLADDQEYPDLEFCPHCGEILQEEDPAPICGWCQRDGPPSDEEVTT